MKLILFVAVAASFVGASLGQVLGFGACPSVTVQEDFNISKVRTSSEAIPSMVHKYIHT